MLELVSRPTEGSSFKTFLPYNEKGGHKGRLTLVNGIDR